MPPEHVSYNNHPGTGVGIGRDYTIFAVTDGVVEFSRFGKTRKRVSVVPVEA